MRAVMICILGFCFVCCSIPATAAVSTQATVSSGTISFPCDIMTIELGMPVKKFLKLRPGAHPLTLGTYAPDQGIVPGTAIQILSEELPGGPQANVIYTFIDGTLSGFNVGWLEFKEPPHQVRDSLLKGGDKLWGSKRELAVFEYLQDGRKKQYVEYRWPFRGGRASLGFTSSGMGVSLAKGDTRSIKRAREKARSDARLTGEAERKVLANFGLMPNGERQEPGK